MPPAAGKVSRRVASIFRKSHKSRKNTLKSDNGVTASTESITRTNSIETSTRDTSTTSTRSEETTGPTCQQEDLQRSETPDEQFDGHPSDVMVSQEKAGSHLSDATATHQAQSTISTETSSLSRPSLEKDVDLSPGIFSVNTEPERLWDEAYDCLKTEQPELVLWYERILSLRLEGGAQCQPQPEGTLSPSDPVQNLIHQDDREVRCSQMSQLLDIWMNDIAVLVEYNDDLDTDGRPTVSLKDLLRGKAVSMPQATLAWVCACIVSKILLSLTPQSDTDSRGIIYATSRIEWYTRLHTLLEPSASADVHSLGAEEKQPQLLLINLYKAVLSFLMSIVCRHYGSQALDLSWNLPDATILEMPVATVVEAENALSSSFGQSFKQHLENLVDSSDTPREHSLHEHKETQAAPQDSHVFADLHAIDPRSGMPEPACSHDDPMMDTYRWLTSTEEYRKFIDWEDQGSRTLWITGNAGSGKSMLMGTIVRNLAAQARESPKAPRLSFFFCGGNAPDINSPMAVLKALIGLLLVEQPVLETHLEELRVLTERKHFDHPNDFQALSGLFHDITRDEDFLPTYFVVDAIDECSFGDSWPRLDDFLNFITAATKWEPKIRWLVSGGSQDICSKLAEGAYHLELDPNSKHISTAVKKYIAHMISDLAKDKGYEKSMENEVLRSISERSRGNFLWIHILCRTLRAAETWHALNIIEDAPSDLQSLFAHMDERIKQLPYDDGKFCRQVLYTAAVAYQPLHISELSAISELPRWVDLNRIVQKCCGFLDVRSDIVCFTHQSAKSHVRETALNDHGGHWGQLHALIGQQCLNSLSNFFGSNSANFPSKKCDCGNEEFLAPVRYASFWWMKHICAVNDIEEQQVLVASIISFLNKHVLPWLEVLHDTGRLAWAVTQCRTLAVFLKKKFDTASEIVLTIQDSYRLLEIHASANNTGTIQVANSLLFSAHRSRSNEALLKDQFPWIIAFPSVVDWSADFQVLKGHSNWVRQVDFSTDGRLLASASDDRTVRVWDVETGTIQRIFQDHDDWVMCVDISLTGLVASGSDDYYLRIWDLATGKLVEALNLDGRVYSVKFSPDSSRLFAFESRSNSLSIWDMSTNDNRKHERTGEGSSGSVAYSADGARIAWGTSSSIKVLDTKDFSVVCTIPATASSLAFSSDGKHLASTYLKEIRIWDIGAAEETDETAKEVATLVCADKVRTVSFSPDGSSLASTLEDGMINFWDVLSRTISTVLPQTERSLDATFSPTGQYLATAAADGLVRLWYNKPRNLGDVCAAERLQGYITIIAVSPDRRYIASAQSRQVLIWDAQTGQHLGPKKPITHNNTISHLAFSPDGSNRLVSSSHDETAKIHDVDGNLLQTLDSHGDWVRQSAFSLPDGRYVATACDDGEVRVWDLQASPEDKPAELKGHCDYVRCVAFSPDGQMIAAGGDDGTVRVWERRKEGDCIKWAPKNEPMRHDSEVFHVVFYLDSQRLLSSCNSNTISIWDVQTGERIGEPVVTEHNYRGLWFDAALSTDYVMTDLGARVIPTIGVADESAPYHVQKPSGAPYSIVCRSEAGSSDEYWITWNGREIIYIPKEFEPTATLVFGHTVVVGCYSGDLLVFGFAPGVEPPKDVGKR